MPEGDDRLLEWASDVADGRAVDWDSIPPPAGVTESRLRNLRIVAAIARACRMPPVPPEPSGGVLFRWGHLDIRERIGAGSFGEVYRGWDTNLEREVAVKFLRAEALAAVTNVLQEGRHLARIRHPGVVSVFGAEERDGRVGTWMEYVRGQTLEDLLGSRGRFTSHEALLVGIDLCRALAAVHGAGLVHRDVKARNVVREDTGRIVLMDLGAGLDLRSGREASGDLTGTPIYMAPEVLAGESPSARSDLYGLGVLLYRLVTNSYPCTAVTLEELRSARARAASPAAGGLADLPAAFRHVVERALAPDPEDRYASAAHMEAALVAALEAPRRAVRRRAAIAVVAATMVAVLGIAWAVRQLSPPPPPSSAAHPPVIVADLPGGVHDPDLDALPGMLTTSLDQSRVFSVVTRPQVSDLLALAGRSPDARIDQVLGLELCRRQRAAALLVPNVRREDDGYLVDVAALDPRHGRRLFSASARARGKEDVPAAIDSISRTVCRELGRHAGTVGPLPPPVARITTASLAAYRHYDEAERRIHRLSMSEARTELERAVALDSTFALAHARLAYVCWWLNDEPGERAHLAAAFAMIDRVPERERFKLRAQGAMADRQGLEVARSILLEMERFYPEDKEMLYDIGDYSSHLDDFPQAIQYLERVIAVDPRYPRALQHMARVYRDMGRFDRCLAWAQRYAAADSVWDAYVLLGNALVASGHPDAGIATLARGRAVAPQHRQDFDMFIAFSHLLQGHLEEGGRELDERVRTAATPAERAGAMHVRALGSVHRGAYRAALGDLRRAAAQARRSGDAVAECRVRMQAAMVCAVALGDPAGAFRELEPRADPETTITYRQTYYDYWPYWGGLFKLQLLAGNIPAAEALAKRKFVADKWYGPYSDAYLQAARGNCVQAAAAASHVLEWGPADENIALLYFLARCQLAHGQARDALATLHGLLALHSQLTLGTPYLAPGLMLAAEAAQRCGDETAAARSYSRLLDLWREADPDLPGLREARQRLGRPHLQAASTPRGP